MPTRLGSEAKQANLNQTCQKHREGFSGAGSSGPEVVNLFSRYTQLSMKFELHISIGIQVHVVGIKGMNCRHFYIYEQDKF